MRYVSLYSSFITQRLFIAMVCCLANTSQPAFGGESTTLPKSKVDYSSMPLPVHGTTPTATMPTAQKNALPMAPYTAVTPPQGNKLPKENTEVPSPTGSHLVDPSVSKVPLATTLTGDEVGSDGADPVDLSQNESSGTGAHKVDLHVYQYSDENIAELCKASIAKQYDMVDTTDADGHPRRVPRCVLTYEGMRAISDQYLVAQEEEVAKLKTYTLPENCDEANANQRACIEAGQQFAPRALSAHETMLEHAKSAEEKLGIIHEGGVITAGQ